MTGILLAVLIPLAYMGAAVVTARLMFPRIRPYREPLSCSSRRCGGRGGHWRRCYRQVPYGWDWSDSWAYDTRNGAATLSAVTGILWPFIVAALFAVQAARGVRWTVTSGSRELPPETAAKTKRLERELGIKGDGDQEGGRRERV